MHQPDPKYFDYAASAPPYPEALAMQAEVSGQLYANPSSIHRTGAKSRDKLAELKAGFLALLGFSQGRMLLCASGTEANNTLIEGHIRRFPESRILIAANVHDSIWYATVLHRKHVDVLPVTEKGQVSKDDFLKSIKPGTVLLCLSHACGETGAVQDLHDISRICAECNIRLMIDGAQTVGHLPLNLDVIPFDYYTFSSHKFGAARGTGGILLRTTEFEPLLRGGKQEYQLRAGTENVGGLASAFEALKISLNRLGTESMRLKQLSSLLINELRARGVKMILNSPPDNLSGFVSLSFPGYSGSEIVTALSHSGFSVSTGSACHANQVEPSRVILAMGRSPNEAKGTIRITMGRGTSKEAVLELAMALNEFVNP